MHTLICVTFSFPPGVRGSLRLLLVALPGLFSLTYCFVLQTVLLNLSPNPLQYFHIELQKPFLQQHQPNLQMVGHHDL